MHHRGQSGESVPALQRQPGRKRRDKHIGQVAAEHTDRLLPGMTKGSLFKVLCDERVVVAVAWLPQMIGPTGTRKWALSWENVQASAVLACH